MKDVERGQILPLQGMIYCEKDDKEKMVKHTKNVLQLTQIYNKLQE